MSHFDPPPLRMEVFESFFPSSPSRRGQWRNFGISNPSARQTRIWRAVESSRSSPRTISVIRSCASSTEIPEILPAYERHFPRERVAEAHAFPVGNPKPPVCAREVSGKLKARSGGRAELGRENRLGVAKAEPARAAAGELFYFAPRMGRRIGESARGELPHGGLVGGNSLALPVRAERPADVGPLVPKYARALHVGDGGVLVLFRAPLKVDVVYAQDHLPAGFARPRARRQKSPRVADVQQPRDRRRDARPVPALTHRRGAESWRREIRAGRRRSQTLCRPPP